MFLTHLELTNFRDFSKLELDLDPVMLFVGKNAQGKSNLLESVFFVSATKSPRPERETQLIKDGESFCRVVGEVQSTGIKREDLTKIEVYMQKAETENSQSGGRVIKMTKVNGVSRRIIDYLGHLVTVYFTPEDINLVTGSPSLRRWHLDLTLAQIDREYKTAITTYTESLFARNRILKRIQEGAAKSDELDFWEEKMIGSAKVLSLKRQAFFDFINSSDSRLGNYQYDYLPNLFNAFRLSEYKSRELLAAVSLIGPQRDDFVFSENRHNLAFFGSRGEQRSAVLNLKLKELEFIKNVTHRTPVLLLDDVFSELDLEHRTFVAGLVKSQQTLITAVEGEILPEQLLNSSRRFLVVNGTVVKP